MKCKVLLCDSFEEEFDELAEAVRLELIAGMSVLEKRGPQAGRPHVDTLKGSKYANMKELRFEADDGVWRFAFAFDPERQAIVFCGGDKSGVSQNWFTRR